MLRCAQQIRITQWGCYFELLVFATPFLRNISPLNTLLEILHCLPQREQIIVVQIHLSFLLLCLQEALHFLAHVSFCPFIEGFSLILVGLPD